MGLVRLLAFIAVRGLARSRLTTVLLMLAVAFGVGLQIPNTANLLGYSKEMFEEATTRGFGDVRVQHPREPLLHDGDALARELRSVPGVRDAVPFVTLPGAITFKGRQLVAEVHGIDAGSAYRPYRVKTGGDLAAPTDEEGLLIGSKIANSLGIVPGDHVTVRVLFPAAKEEPAEEFEEPAAPTREEYTLIVRGTVSGAFGAYDSLVLRRHILLRGLARPHAATRVAVYAGTKLGDAGVSTARREAPLLTNALADAIRAKSGDLLVTTWMGDHPYAYSALRANEVLGIVSHTMVVVAVTIPVGALLFVTVESRRRDIAMLAALGIARLEIFVAFILQATVIATVGGVLGCALGGGMLMWFRAYPIFDSGDFVVRPVSTVNGFIEPALVILATTVIAALYPAWRATRVQPAPVLRGAA